MAASEFDPTATFGSYLRFLRRRARLTQTDLGIAVGYSPGQISMLENGQRTPDLTVVSALFIAVLGLENDKPSATQLLKLAQTALAQAASPKAVRLTAPVETQNTTQPKATLVVEQQITWQREELGLLEDIPPLPIYAVPRLGPLQRLQQWFTRERAVAICGLAGMGKSTLAAAYAHAYAQQRPVLWMTSSHGVNQASEAMLRQVALFVAAYAKDATVVTPLFRQPSAAEPRLAFPALVLMVAAGLNELDAPLLVFDDAHHIGADAQCLQALQRLSTLAPHSRLLLVTREELSLPGLLHLTLAGLERAEALDLVAHLSRQALPPLALPDQRADRTPEVTEPVFDTLFTQTVGSPMLLRLAVSQLEQAPLTADQVGASVANYLVETVLKNLEPAAWQALGFLTLWRGVVDITNAALSELLSEELGESYDHALAVAALQRRRLIDHPAHATPHRLLREPMLAALNSRSAQRRTLHQAAAKWAGLNGDLSEAAHHYCCAGDLQSACDVITKETVSSYALGRSVAVAAVVDELLGAARNRPQTPALREMLRQLHLLRGDLLVHTLRTGEAHASYRAAMELTTQTLARAHIAERLAVSLFQRGQFQEALELAEQALALLTVNMSGDAMRLRFQLEGARVKALLALARFSEARQLCERALTLVKPLALILPAKADQARASLYLALGYMARHQGQLAEAEAALTKAIKHARNGQARDVEADALIYLSATQRDLGNFAGAEANAQQALTVAQAIENVYLASNILHFMTIISYYRDEQMEALARSQRALALKQPMGDLQGSVGCRIIQALVYTALNDLPEARCIIEQALVDSEQLENNWLQGFALYIAGIVLTFQGEGAAAEARMARSLTLEGFTKDQPSSAGAHIFLGIAYLMQGKLAQAQQVTENLLPPGSGIDIELLRGLLRGMLYLARGEREAAKAVAAQTVQQAHATGYLIYAAEAEQLERLCDNPPPLVELPRAVCCRG